LILIFLVLAAIVVGGLVAEATSGVAALKWLTYGEGFGFNMGNTAPLIDLSVFKLALGVEMKVSVLQILLICSALLVYRKVR